MTDRINHDESEISLLREVHKSSGVSSDALCTLIPKVHDKFMLADITARLEHYGDFKERCASMLASRGYEAKKQPPLNKIGMNMGILMECAADSAPSHIANMIVEASERSMERIEDRLESVADNIEGSDALDISLEFLRYEEKENERMKKYIKSPELL